MRDPVPTLQHLTQSGKLKMIKVASLVLVFTNGAPLIADRCDTLMSSFHLLNKLTQSVILYRRMLGLQLG